MSKTSFALLNKIYHIIKKFSSACTKKKTQKRKYFQILIITVYKELLGNVESAKVRLYRYCDDEMVDNGK